MGTFRHPGTVLTGRVSAVPLMTSEYSHDGLRVSDGAVLDRLIGVCRGDI